MTGRQLTSGGAPSGNRAGLPAWLGRTRFDKVLRRLGAILWMTLGYTFIFSPIIVVAGSSFDGSSLDLRGNSAFLNFPPQNFTFEWYTRISPSLYNALWISFSMASIAAACGIVLGVPAALALIRGNFPGRIVLGTLFRAPLQIPFIVIGLAFLQAYYEVGSLIGLQLRATFAGLVIGHVFVATPYVVGSVGAVLQRFDLSLEEAALSLGASPWRTFTRVTLPIIMPGVLAGGIYAFLVSFGDVTISLFLTGPNISPLPVEIFFALDREFDPTIPAMATIVIVGSGLLLYVIQRLVGIDILLRGGGNG
jgi:putative spermidine/putrescine transport system permease protein